METQRLSFLLQVLLFLSLQSPPFFPSPRLRSSKSPTKFCHHELKEATDGFRSILGRGGSGAVYKGILSDGAPVAVKRIDIGEERGEKIFKFEVAAISGLQHGGGDPVESVRVRVAFLGVEYYNHSKLQGLKAKEAQNKSLMADEAGGKLLNHDIERERIEMQKLI